MLGALLLLSLLFVHLPAALWAGNTGEFHWRFGTFLYLGLGALTGGIIVAFVTLAVLPRTARAALASLLGAVGLVSWLYAFFLAGHMTALNGMDAPMHFDTSLGVWELAAVGAAWLLIGFAISRARRAAIVAFLVLNVGLAVTTATAVRAATRHRVRAPVVQDAGPVFRFSTRDNVLVVLLDGLQSDIAYAILRSDVRLERAFEGFRFYKDTLGVAPTTFVSLPAIHSGMEYRNQESLGAYFEESIRIQSFMNRFADAGYQTALVNPIEGACPDHVATCPTSTQILRTSEAQLRAESLRLLDVSLFRLAPVWLKSRIYSGGNWFLAGRFDMAQETSRIFEHNLLFAEMARRITVDEGPPTMKFVHSLATHTPFVLSNDCRTTVDTSWANLPPQAHCALLAVARLLDALKAAGVYDRTEIALVADHGIGQPDGFVSPAALHIPAHADWVRRAGYANPMFLLKPRGARGEITNDPSSIYLPDLGATLCASSGACTTPAGVPAGQGSRDRVRRYLEYDWKHEFWQVRDIPDVRAYEVRGALWDVTAWKRVETSEMKSGK